MYLVFCFENFKDRQLRASLELIASLQSGLVRAHALLRRLPNDRVEHQTRGELVRHAVHRRIHQPRDEVAFHLCARATSIEVDIRRCRMLSETSCKSTKESGVDVRVCQSHTAFDWIVKVAGHVERAEHRGDQLRHVRLGEHQCSELVFDYGPNSL